jgi:hypothetical protein
MKHLIAIVFASLSLSPSTAASASGIDARLPIYYSWVVETLLPSAPEVGHYSMRIVPWKKVSEVLLDTDGSSVHVRQAKHSLWSELREVLRHKPSISADELVKQVAVVEMTVSTDRCAALAPALESIRTSYSVPLPDVWSVYADGPSYTLARHQDPFGGAEIISHPHEDHPVAQAWLRTIAVLNACGAQIVAEAPKL